jgi:hypothetical protein
MIKSNIEENLLVKGEMAKRFNAEVAGICAKRAKRGRKEQSHFIRLTVQENGYI